MPGSVFVLMDAAKGRARAAGLGVIDLAVKDGVASTRTLLVDTTDSKVLGNGEINLAREQLNLTFNVQPKDPSILSLRAPIHLTGSLRKPQVRPDTATLATKGIAALALAAINPLLALLPTIETGPGEDADCKQLIAEAPSFTERGALRSGAGNEAKLPPDAPKPPASQARPTDKSTTNGAMPSYPN